MSFCYTNNKSLIIQILRDKCVFGKIMFALLDIVLSVDCKYFHVYNYGT
jgi:hypothetical protein